MLVGVLFNERFVSSAIIVQRSYVVCGQPTFQQWLAGDEGPTEVVSGKYRCLFSRLVFGYKYVTTCLYSGTAKTRAATTNVRPYGFARSVRCRGGSEREKGYLIGKCGFRVR